MCLYIPSKRNETRAPEIQNTKRRSSNTDMAKVHLLNVTVHNNPAPFFTPFQFEIHFECLEELQDGIESIKRKLFPKSVKHHLA